MQDRQEDGEEKRNWAVKKVWLWNFKVTMLSQLLVYPAMCRDGMRGRRAIRIPKITLKRCIGSLFTEDERRTGIRDLFRL